MSSSKQAIHRNGKDSNISDTETFVTCKRDQSGYRTQHTVGYTEKPSDRIAIQLPADKLAPSSLTKLRTRRSWTEQRDKLERIPKVPLPLDRTRSSISGAGETGHLTAKKALQGREWEAEERTEMERWKEREREREREK